MQENPAIGSFIEGVRRGDWDGPKDLVAQVDAYHRLRTAGTPDNGELPATRQATVAAMIDAALNGRPLPGEDTVSGGARSLDFALAWEAGRKDAVAQLVGQINQVDKNTLITYLQPALAQVIDGFRADVTAAGRWATIDSGSIPRELLTEPAKVREAVLRIFDIDAQYMPIRQAWRALRPAQNPTDYGYDVAVDPDLLIAEIKNVPAVWPEWRTYDPYRHAAPWGSNATGSKLSWLLAHGGEVWVPTHREQLEHWYVCYPPEAKHPTAEATTTVLDRSYR